MSTRPFVSVIIPLRNEVTTIRACLEAILGQDYGSDHFEILVADGRSDDGTIAVLAEYAACGAVRVLDNPERLTSTGLNRCLAVARGEIIARVDGHTIVAPNYLSACVAALETSSAANVGGRMQPLGRTRIGRLIGLATSSPFGIGDSKFHFATTPQWVDTVYLGAWRRDLFDQIGGFDETMHRHQDYEFNYRTRRHGGHIWFTPTIRSWYFPRESLLSFVHQYFTYGWWKATLVAREPASIRWRHLVAPLFVLSLLVGLLSGGGRLLALELSLYAALAIGESLRQVVRHRSFEALALPPVFLILHLAWGSGVVARLASLRWISRPMPARHPLPERPFNKA
ncbi:MAG: glycosyltransferase family 2 protein [Ardenticatenaceae bacterium]|nr:glycosyltransferase family 2 protein [Ardenticatenaceae bacterium]HBY92800.1 glycosyltransferase family 2 protein [Chloroflexota bacterium]